MLKKQPRWQNIGILNQVNATGHLGRLVEAMEVQSRDVASHTEGRHHIQKFGQSPNQSDVDVAFRAGAKQAAPTFLFSSCCKYAASLQVLCRRTASKSILRIVQYHFDRGLSEMSNLTTI